MAYQNNNQYADQTSSQWTKSVPASSYGSYGYNPPAYYQPPYNPELEGMSGVVPGGSYSGPPGYSSVYPQVDNSAKLKEFYRKYEISPLFQEDIECVKKYDIHVIADDSSSMTEPSEYLSFRTNTIVKKTRWDELHETIEVITELAILLDDDGIDLWFLNVADPVKNVTSKETVMMHFNRVPRGRTPLTSVLARVMQEPSASGKPKLILIATDGEPNDDDGYDDSENFLRLLKSRNVDRNRISILACTTSEKQMEWLNRVDKEAKHVDVIDDYLTERGQILAVQGSSFTYSHGDHVLKMLLGPVLQKYDDLDEKPLKTTNRNASTIHSSGIHSSAHGHNGSRGSKSKQNDCVIL